MTNDHYNTSFDSLSELEQTINGLPQLKSYLLYVQEKSRKW
jgi:hypothetical protein